MEIREIDKNSEAGNKEGETTLRLEWELTSTLRLSIEWYLNFGVRGNSIITFEIEKM